MKKTGWIETTRRRSILAVAISMMLALTACGSSGDKAGAGDKIVIGVIGQFSGAQSSTYGGIPTALDAWEKSVNSAGGINGHKVRVKIDDVGQATGASVSAARSLITKDKVAALISFDQSDITWVKYAEQNSVPVISGVATPAPLVSPDVFSIGVNSVAAAYAGLALAKTVGPEFAIGYPAELPTAAQIVALIRGFSKVVGVKLAVAAKLSSSLPDYTAFCQQLKDAGVDSYLLALTGAVSQKISDQCYQQGIRVTQIILGPNLNAKWKSDPSFDGSVVLDGVAPFFDTSVPGVAAYRKALEKYEPNFTNSSTDTTFAAFAWASGKLLEKAIGGVHGDVTGTAIQNALYGIKGETLNGLTAPLTYTKGKTSPVNCWFRWAIQNGQFAAPDGAKPQCAPAAVMDPVLKQVAASLK